MGEAAEEMSADPEPGLYGRRRVSAATVEQRGMTKGDPWTAVAHGERGQGEGSE